MNFIKVLVTSLLIMYSLVFNHFKSSSFLSLFFFFCFVGLELELGAFTLSHSTTPPAYFCEGVFEIGSKGTIYPGWLRTTILLISAS
jgi:hypothetical protein